MEASINCWYTDTLGVGVTISVGGFAMGPSPGWAALRASTTRVDPPPAQESPVPRAPDLHPSPSRVAEGVQRTARRSKFLQVSTNFLLH